MCGLFRELKCQHVNNYKYIYIYYKPDWFVNFCQSLSPFLIHSYKMLTQTQISVIKTFILTPHHDHITGSTDCNNNKNHPKKQNTCIKNDDPSSSVYNIRARELYNLRSEIEHCSPKPILHQINTQPFPVAFLNILRSCPFRKWLTCKQLLQRSSQIAKHSRTTVFVSRTLTGNETSNYKLVFHPDLMLLGFGTGKCN